ncbi:FCD domain-containing protein [Baekduia sp.]|uniref:FCD domain-containing protein n=1 Tax=Baekduia sp. TaxID=2600305 RepID=UPI002DF77620|nr:FCD domain-containing protein [Baekduia sp.]
MTYEPVPFDLKLAREAFGTAAELHGAATRRAADRLTDADYDHLAAHDADYVAALTDGRVQDGIAADDAFHRVILDAADDPDLIVSVELLLPRLRRMDLWLFARKAFAHGESSHPAIITALRTGNAELAATLVEASFTTAGEELAAAVERSEHR